MNENLRTGPADVHPGFWKDMIKVTKLCQRPEKKSEGREERMPESVPGTSV